MKISACALMISLFLLVGDLPAGQKSTGRENQSPRAAALAGIEKLHQQDIRATRSQNIDELTNLWTDDGVLIEQGGPLLVGKAAIHADLVKSHKEDPNARDLSYAPHIRDIQIAGDWAFEWGTFDAAFQEGRDKRTMKFAGRFLRVLKRQKDGSWKFARVLWNTE
jgi:ketosteroid isomerase-like protein